MLLSIIDHSQEIKVIRVEAECLQIAGLVVVWTTNLEEFSWMLAF